MRTWKKFFIGFLLLTASGIFSCQDPNSTPNEYTVTVSGLVYNVVDSPQDSVVLTLDTPFLKDTTATDGSFNFSFTTSEKNEVTTNLRFHHINFTVRDTIVPVIYSSTKKDISLGAIRMQGDSTVTGGPSSRPGVITFVGSSLKSISIRGAGSNDATNLTFEVRDSLGIPVDEKNKATVYFELVTKPDPLTDLNRSSAVTNTDGQVSVLLTAGEKSGLVQVYAYATVKKASDTTQTDTIKSSIVSIAVAGGFPVPSRFTIGADRYNVPGLVRFGDRVNISAVVGDTFGNPVQSGTKLYFTTNGGIIQSEGNTNQEGTLTVSLTTGNPIPPGGIATITAQVGTSGGGGGGSVAPLQKSEESIQMDETVIIKGLRSKKISLTGKPSSKIIEKTNAAAIPLFSKTVNVLFTGAPIVSVADTNTFIVPALGSKAIQFTVADENGNPMSQGTTIKVTGVGFDTTGAILNGDIDKVLPDTYDRSFTQFAVNVSDKRTKNLSSNVPVQITIEVSGDNGSIKRTIQGILSSAGSPNGKVGDLSLVNSTIEEIKVTGVGSPNSLLIQAKVLDVNGLPSDSIPVNFTIIRSVNGGEYLSAPVAITDNTGIASTTLFSGVHSGLVQVQASVRRDTTAITTDPKNVYIRTGALASIAVVSLSSTSLSVKGGGGNENATMVFEGRDSLGNPIDVTNQATISFTMLGDTNGTKISPSLAKTDPNTGQVTASFSSGTKSGIIQIRAFSGTVFSPPATVTVSGGFAVDSLFNFTGLRKNYSIYDAGQISIGVLVGDEYGNPVKPGTPIAFATDAGVITASSLTDNSGRATAILQIVNDKKLLGQRFVTAKTIGSNGTEVKKTKTFILTGSPIISVPNVPSDSIYISDGSSGTINFTIADTLGNPISQGHDYIVSIEGSVTGQLLLQGNSSGTILDSDDKLNATTYSILISDVAQNVGPGGNFKVRIVINGTTGITSKTIYGVLLPPADIIVPPIQRKPASIKLVDVSNNDISIKGVGGIENATIIYEVRDSVGTPITLDNRAIINFKSNFFPNTFVPGGSPPTILPTLDSTDENGLVRVSIASGTQAGAVQLKATINLTNPSRTITSEPVTISVNSGFADQAHFTMAPEQFNFPGLERAFLTMPITVQVADKFSNPVKEETSVYFNTANGAIQTLNGLTNRNGFVIMTLFSGNPYPLAPNLAPGLTNGFSYTYARTLGRDSTWVLDSLEILWTGHPLINSTTAFDTFTVNNGGSAGPFTFTVMDFLNHPMSPGTVISVEAPGLSVSGNANITMPDTKFGGPGSTSFTITVFDGNDQDTDPPAKTQITIVVAHPVYGTYKRIIATGSVD